MSDLEREAARTAFYKAYPEVMQRFRVEEYRHQSLCDEVRLILERRLRQNKIAFSHVSARVKDIDSFIEKLSRKQYSQPFEQMTDFAGARVVHLYADDMPRIHQLILDNFCVEKVDDKSQGYNPNEFGYRAIHYDVKLGDKHTGPRVEEISSLVCEVQVRTVLQDAWAVMDHHLAYKKDHAFTPELRRKLNSLAGLLETADDQFFRIRQERDTNLAEVEVIEAEGRKQEALKEWEWEVEQSRIDREWEKGN